MTQRPPAGRGPAAPRPAARAATPRPAARRPSAPTSVRQRSSADRGAVVLGRPGVRLRGGLLAVLIMLSLIAGRLVWLQGFQAEAYAADAIAQRLSTVQLQAPRGQITDRNGQVLAMSVDARLIYGEPRTISKARCASDKPCDPATIAAELGPALGLPVDELAERLSLTPKATGATCSATELVGCRGYVVLAHGLEPPEANKIRDLGLVGIGTAPEPRRVLPAKDVAANVVGYTTVEGRGTAGIEQQYDSVLAGKDGKRTAEIDGGGRIIPNGRTTTVEPQAGRDVQLTIDRDLQFYAQQVLAEQVETSQAESGSATVMDIRTGEVLALATVPTFDANDPSAVDASLRGNRAVTSPDEPGSVGKAITAAAVLEAGTLTPDSVLTVPDRYKLSNKVFKDSSPHPTQQLTFTGVLVESSNVGTIKAAQTIGGPKLHDMLERFGIGSRTGIELPAETAGILRDEKDWSGTDYGTHPIGQGYAATGLQMASVYATIANGGVRMQPTVLRGMADADGALQPATPAAPRRVISQQVADQLRGMLEGVTNDGGTAPQAAIGGYRVAGKTGTAQIAVDGGYSGYTGSFVGFAPADRPQLAVAVSIQRPTKGSYYGGLVAAPVFQKIMSFALRAEGVPPTGALSPELQLRAD